jgi:hypothetical protein
MKSRYRFLAGALILASLALLNACQPAAVRQTDSLQSTDGGGAGKYQDLGLLSASAGVGGGAVRTDLSSSSIHLPDYMPVRRYTDVFTIDGANRKVIVEYAWDYQNGVVVEKVYDEAGRDISRTEKPGYTLNFTDRELELAIALAREDPQLRTVLAAEDLNFYAGFPYRDASERDCNEKSRCVHVIVSAEDGQRHVAHAIVDLMTRRVIHPYLDPERKPDPIPGKF